MRDSRLSRGLCGYCGREMTRAGMSRHLGLCEVREGVLEDTLGQNGERVPLLHVQARDAWTGQYWLNLEVDCTAPLAQLDAYLRAVWLECCGHLSRFSFGGWAGDEVSMSERVGRVIHPGVELTHTYDIGTETFTMNRGLAVRKGHRTTPRPITLMARLWSGALSAAAPAVPRP